MFFDEELLLDEHYTDVINNVPLNKNLVFRLDKPEEKLDGKIFEPRISEFLKNEKLKKDYYDAGFYEDDTIPRICFSSSIQGCLRAIPPERIGANINDKNKILNVEFDVYIPENPLSEYKYLTNKEINKRKLIYDSRKTKEIWILEPVKLKYFATIIVDKLESYYTETVKKFSNEEKNCYTVCTYKWHWKVKPKNKNPYKNLNESYIFTKDDKYINFDKWENKQINLLLITGLSGSGKSTLAKELSKKFNAEYIELDLFERAYKIKLEDLHEIFVNFFKQNKDIYSKILKRERLGEKEWKPFLYYIIEYTRKNKNRRFIVEGVQIYYAFNYEELKNFSIILKNTSLAKSYIRNIKRRIEHNKNSGNRESIKDFELLKMLGWYFEDEKLFSNFKDKLKRGNKTKEELKKLFNEINNYGYGWIYKGKKICDESNMYETYRTLSPKEFKKYKIGVCWDYVAYEYSVLKNKIDSSKEEIHLFFSIINNEMQSTHTWLTIFNKENELYTVLEISFKDYAGIYEFSNLDYMISFYINNFRKYYKNDKFNKITIVDFKQPEKYGLSTQQYMEYMNTQKTICEWKEIDDFKMLDEEMKLYNGRPKLFFISKDNMNNKTLNPKIPNNYFTKNGYEDNKTERVCFAPSIDNCLMALSQNLKNKEFYIHIPEYKQLLDIYKPTKSEVPDSVITNEYWIKNSVKIKCIGKIKVLGDDGKDGLKFKYGKHETELYGWKWKWIKKYSLNEEEINGIKGNLLDESNNFFTLLENEYYNGNKNPIFIITSFTFTTFGNITKLITNAKFSHAAISLDHKLHTMYSFNTNNGVNDKGGFSIENIDNYTKNSEKSIIKVNVMFVNDRNYHAIKNFIEKFKENIKNTSYNYKHLLFTLINKKEKTPDENRMICSEFVYSIFKLIHSDILNKSSNLVTPQDLSEIKDKRIYNVFNGLIVDYNSKKVNNKINKLKKTALIIGETIDNLNFYDKFNKLNSFNKSLLEEFDLERINNFYVTDNFLDCKLNEISIDEISNDLEIAVSKSNKIKEFKNNPSFHIIGNSTTNLFLNVYHIRELGNELTIPVFLGIIMVKLFKNGKYEYTWHEKNLLNEENYNKENEINDYMKSNINLHCVHRNIMISSINYKEKEIANVIMFDNISSNLLYVRDILQDKQEFFVYINIDNNLYPEFSGKARMNTDFNCKEIHNIYSYPKIVPLCIGKIRINKTISNKIKNEIEKDNFNIETIYSITIGEMQGKIENYDKKKKEIIKNMLEEE